MKTRAAQAGHMVMAHMTGKGVETHAHLGPRYLLMAEEDIL